MAVDHIKLQGGAGLDLVRAIAEQVKLSRGRVLMVGGYVREWLIAQSTPPAQLNDLCQDIDLEVYGLDIEALVDILRTFGNVNTVGRAFGVVKLVPQSNAWGLSDPIVFDISLPRVDNKTGQGHRGFVACTDPHLPFEQAFARRDLTLNSIGLDPLTGEVIDPFNGRTDIAEQRLRATSPVHFSEDPLRGLRVAQFAARLGFAPDDALIKLSGQLDFSELPGERLGAEFEKLLLKGRQPSLGLKFLDESGLLRFFPELEALKGVPQNPHWHPEGDVWIHTLMVVDEAAQLREQAGDLVGQDRRLLLMYAALCHDFGKPACTEITSEGVARSPGHENFDAPVVTFLDRLKLSHDLIHKVKTLVKFHLAPYQFPAQKATPAAYRRLARALAPMPLTLLGLLARADMLGRGASVRDRVHVVDEFLVQATQADVAQAPASPVVLGRHLLELGIAPGPHMGVILTQCQEDQDATGELDQQTILRRVLNKDKI